MLKSMPDGVVVAGLSTFASEHDRAVLSIISQPVSGSVSDYPDLWVDMPFQAEDVSGPTELTDASIQDQEPTVGRALILMQVEI